MATLKDIMEFFEFGTNAAKFRAEWAKLTDADKAQIRAGITDGSLNY